MPWLTTEREGESANFLAIPNDVFANLLKWLLDLAKFGGRGGGEVDAACGEDVGEGDRAGGGGGGACWLWLQRYKYAAIQRCNVAMMMLHDVNDPMIQHVNVHDAFPYAFT